MKRQSVGGEKNRRLNGRTAIGSEKRGSHLHSLAALNGAAVRSSDLPLSEMLATLFDGVCVIDPNDGNILFANLAFEEMLGYPHGELLGYAIAKLEEDRGDGAMSGACRLRKKDGTWCACRVRTLPFSSGRDDHRILRIYSDVTKIGDLQDRLRKVADETEAAARLRVQEITRANEVLQAENMERRRAEEVLQTEADRLTEIIATQYEIARAGHELLPVLTMIVHRAQKLTGADSAVVDLLEADWLVRRVAVGAAADTVGLRLRMRTSLSGECILKRGVVRCDNAETDPRVDWNAAMKSGFRSVVALPLLRNQEPVGALKVMSTRGSAFCERDLHTLELLSGLVSTAMSNAAEFEVEEALLTERTRAVSALKARSRQQDVVTELGHRALAGGEIQALLDYALARVQEILQVDACDIFERESGESGLIMRAGAGWDGAPIQAATVPHGSGSPAGGALLTGEPVVVEDFHHEHRFPWPLFLRARGIVSSVSVAMHGRGEPCRVLSAHATLQHSFSSDEIHFLQSIANVLAAAMEQRRLEEELLEVCGREQRRIGQDLHDGLCQELVGMQYRLESLKALLAGWPEAVGEAAKIGSYMAGAITKARTLARCFLPVEMGAEALTAAFRDLTAHTSELFRISCVFQQEGSIRLPDQVVSTEIYRIAQEALHNAVKHGHADAIRVSLRRERGHVVLTVTDNGIGFPPKASLRPGMGLRIMHYRSDLIGATLSIGPAAGGGTMVECRLKLS